MLHDQHAWRCKHKGRHELGRERAAEPPVVTATWTKSSQKITPSSVILLLEKVALFLEDFRNLGHSFSQTVPPMVSSALERPGPPFHVPWPPRLTLQTQGEERIRTRAECLSWSCSLRSSQPTSRGRVDASFRYSVVVFWVLLCQDSWRAWWGGIPELGEWHFLTCSGLTRICNMVALWLHRGWGGRQPLQASWVDSHFEGNEEVCPSCFLTAGRYNVGVWKKPGTTLASERRLVPRVHMSCMNNIIYTWCL